MGWWFLVNDLLASDKIPRAIGPYPSQEFCRIAARQMVSKDRRFWPEAERLEAEQHDKEEAEAREVKRSELIRRAIVDAGLVGKAGVIRVIDGTSTTDYRVDESGKAELESANFAGTSLSWISSDSGPYWSALSDCVEIP